MFSTTDENLAKRYLLGTASEAEQRLVDEQLLRADEPAEHLLMVEDELIDDYARGALEKQEREDFERNFVFTPERRKKLTAAQALARFAATQPEEFDIAVVEQKTSTSESDEAPPNTSRRSSQPTEEAWWRLPFPQWKLIACGAIVIIGALGFWIFIYNSAPAVGQPELRDGLALLHQTFQNQRPLEGRITEFGYAQYPEARRSAAEPPIERTIDHQILGEAEVLLHKALRQKRTAEALRGNGQLYLAKKEFEKARAHFAEALDLTPSDARLRNDLGLAWLELGRNSQRADDQQQHALALGRSLDEFNQAVSLDPTLLEASFNRALCWQELGLIAQARAGWQEYLQKDATSHWAEEARRRLTDLGK